MSYLKKSVVAAGLAAALFTVSPAKSASLNVDTDVSIPDVLILYAYTDIDLQFAAGEFATLLDGSCTSDDCASPLTTAEAGTITSGVADLNITPDLAASGTSASITIQNSWAVRALGYGTFNASVTDNGSESAVSGLAVSPATGTPSMTATPGDVSFDIDLTSTDLDDGLIEANYTITVTGS
ncbi:hypothetical protein [Kangiella shandongensis]|uniref:hypothetical protein n=1 Tax=Kangiella shandongensis TaxID=2763258 RepID=UPI001CC1856B|nr:hypothetical protein [Kangiella shandongensis]